MKPVLADSRYTPKRHRGPHRWSPWIWYGPTGTICNRQCTIDRCWAEEQRGPDGKLWAIYPERWNSGRWKKRKKIKKVNRSRP